MKRKWNIDSFRSPIFFVAGGDDLGFFSLLFSLVLWLLLSSNLLLLASDGFNVSGNEKINHFWPFLIEWDLASKSQDFSGQHPENHGDGLWYSVVAWDNDINKVQGGIGVAQSNGWNVNIWSFNDGLSVALWISNDQKSWFLEFFGQLIGKGTWNPSWWGLGSASCVLTELVDGSLTVLLSANDDNFSEVWNWSNHSCGEFDFLVSLINSENIVALTVLIFDELFHVMINLVSSQVNLKLLSKVR